VPPPRHEQSKPLSRFSIHPLLKLISNRPRPILVSFAILSLASCFPLLHPSNLFSLESDLTVMHPRPNPPLDAQQHIAERLGASPGSLIIHLHADTDDSLLILAHRIDQRLRTNDARAAGITNIYSLASLLPDPSVAPARVTAAGEAYANQVVDDFRRAVAASDFSPAAYEPYCTFLHEILTRTAPPGIDQLRPYRSLADSLLPKSQSTHESLAYVFVRSDETRAARDRAIDSIRAAISDLPGATLTGLSVLSRDTEVSIGHDLPRLVAVAIIAVAVYLLIHFRTLPDSLLALLPTAVSMIALLAFMSICNVKLNMINLVAFPLLIGIDVDYGIFLVNSARYRRARSIAVEQLIIEASPSAHAVLLCAAATILGFGSLMFTSIPAVRSLGLCVSVGVIACVAAVFFLVLPILFILGARK
jgi:uncharacterized protein